MDGCIYLSKILRLIQSKKKSISTTTTTQPSTIPSLTQNKTNPKVVVVELLKAAKSSIVVAATTSSSTKKNPDSFKKLQQHTIYSVKNRGWEKKDQVKDSGNNNNKKSKKGQICLKGNDINETSYILFHTMMENDLSIRFNENNISKSVRWRENLSSAVFASLLLAGKFCECFVTMKTLLLFSKRIPSLVIYNDATHVVSLWGNPSCELIKEYEFHLLSLFGFQAKNLSQYLASSFITEIGRNLRLDSVSIVVAQTQRILHHSTAGTHSPLCLLEDPKLVGYAAFYLVINSTKLNKDMSSFHWETPIGENETVIKYCSEYMLEVKNCVEKREGQLNKIFSSNNQHQVVNGTRAFVSTTNILHCKNVPTGLPIIIENINTVLEGKLQTENQRE